MLVPRFISLPQGKSWEKPDCLFTLSVPRVERLLPTCRACGPSSHTLGEDRAFGVERLNLLKNGNVAQGEVDAPYKPVEIR